MKKGFVLTTAAFCFLVLVTKAQESQQGKPHGTSGYLSFSGGLSFPQGDYSAQGKTTIPGGYAMTGGSLSISLGVTPKKFPLGFAFMGGYYFNRYDLKGFINGRQMNDESATYGTNQSNVNALFYSGFYGMVGLYKEIPIGKVAFDFKALVGELGVSTPEMSYYATQSSGSILGSSTTTWDVSGAKGSAFCYDLGITARIKRYNDVNLFLSFDYLHSVIPYSTVVTYTDQNGNVSNYTSSTNLPVSFISFSLGVGYDLGD